MPRAVGASPIGYARGAPTPAEPPPLPTEPLAPPYTLRPRLRPEVEVEPRAPATAGPCTVTDPLSGHEVRFESAWEARALALLDGRRGLDDLRAALGAEAPPRQALVYFVKRLRYLRLLDDADRAALARLAEARRDPRAHAARVPWSAPRGARFRCQGSTGCCTSFQLGPISEGCARRIEALPGLAERFPALAGRPPIARLALGGEPARYLPGRPDGACSFLDPDGRCGLHVAHGEDAKPLMCRAFPHAVQLLLDRKVLYDRGHCHAYGTSAFEGPSLEERVGGADAAVYEALIADERLHHPQVSVDGYLELDYGLYAPFERHLLALCEDADLGLVRLLDALREALYDLLAALGTADDGAASADAIVARVAAEPVEARLVLAAPRPERARGLRALGGLLQLIYGAVRTSTAGQQDRLGVGHTPRERFEPLLRGLRVASLAAFAEAEGRDASALAAPGDVHARDAGAVLAVRVDLAEPRLARRLRSLARDQIAADEIVERPTLVTSFAALVALFAAMLAVARVLAAEGGRAEASPLDLDRAQALAVRALRLGRGVGLAIPQALGRGVLVDLALPAALAGPV